MKRHRLQVGSFVCSILVYSGLVALSLNVLASPFSTAAFDADSRFQQLALPQVDLASFEATSSSSSDCWSPGYKHGAGDGPWMTASEMVAGHVRGKLVALVSGGKVTATTLVELGIRLQI